MIASRRGILLALAAAAVSGQVALAKAAYIPLPEKVKQCDLIARVTVLSTRKLDAKPVGEYASVAKVRLLEVLKGPSGAREIELAFDNGLACPNVHYKAGEEVLVFLTRERNGRYATFNTYFGKVEPTPKALAEVKQLLDGGRLKTP